MEIKNPPDEAISNYSIVFRSSATAKVASVLAFTSSTEMPGAISVRVRVPRLRSTWKTHCVRHCQLLTVSRVS